MSSVKFIFTRGVNYLDETIDFLRDPREWKLLENKDLNELYRDFHDVCTSSAESCLTYLLLNSGINPLDYMNYIPPNGYYNLDITEIVIPTTIHYIGASAFSYCSKLEKVFVPDSVDTIEFSAFEYCSNLKSIRLPAEFKTDSELDEIFNFDGSIDWYDSVEKFKRKVKLI